MEAGNREMAGLRERTGLQSTVAPDNNKDLPHLPHQPNYTYHPNAPPNQNITALPQMRDNKGYVAPHGTAVQPDSYYTESQPGYLEPDAMSFQTAPNSLDYSGNSNAGADDNRKSLKKLIKRRPVNK